MSSRHGKRSRSRSPPSRRRRSRSRERGRKEARVEVKVGAKVRWARLAVVVLEQEHEQGDEPLEVRLVELFPVAAQVLDLSGKHTAAKLRGRPATSGRQSATPEAARGRS